MGNTEVHEQKIDFFVSAHKPLESGIWLNMQGRRTRRSMFFQSPPSYVLNATLDAPPEIQELFFNCPNCKAQCFDAGLEKIVKCRCNKGFIRRNKIIKPADLSSIRTFDTHFDVQLNSPPSNFVPELLTLTLAVFREGLPENYITSGRTNFPILFDQYLSPFFKQKLRCVGLNDYFKHQNAKFKVLGAFPSYGIVTEKTLISCSEVLSNHPIDRIHILPILPHTLNEHTFSSSIQPFFRSYPRHVISGEYIYLDSKAFMITACQPNDGIVNSETNFYFNGDPLEPIQYFTIVPFLEDLSYHYHALNRENLIEEIINSYIMNHFQGFKRIISLNQLINIDGVAFKVVDCWPHKGVTIDSSRIIYDGSMCRREAGEYYSPNTILIRRGNLMEDPLLILAQQMAQLQESMLEIGIHELRGTSEETIRNLPNNVVSTVPEDPEAGKCMVCLCHYELGEETKTLPCCK